MTAWLFDLGNTRLKFAPLHPDGSLGEVMAVAHDGTRFDAGWEQRLPARCEACSLSSVAAPALRGALLEALASRCGRVSIASTLARCDGVTIAYADPRRLGVDRFLALLAAHARGNGPSLVVGVGTALTVDLVDAQGRHRGGRIAPSPALMRQALHARTAQLPADGGSYAEFAADTADALVSGCEGAALALVERSREAAHALLGARPHLLLHGGGAPALAARLDGAEPAPSLVLEGLARWARMERIFA
ncbi:type III pantothenate kinase [Luteimonas sp. SJ-92]|uniref:Type III pantothenate kinase n=1 Tax=Luteimonas salinisoli TaxID=2752307 RepID=A0A853J9S0_9GAMM|nr:type III pantothenate kinase [Luteimonas salinisoli]NZA25390.1 type III pantothenate kinase [Luteimonas salinisoli]